MLYCSEAFGYLSAGTDGVGKNKRACACVCFGYMRRACMEDETFHVSKLFLVSSLFYYSNNSISISMNPFRGHSIQGHSPRGHSLRGHYFRRHSFHSHSFRPSPHGCFSGWCSRAARGSDERLFRRACYGGHTAEKVSVCLFLSVRENASVLLEPMLLRDASMLGAGPAA